MAGHTPMAFTQGPGFVRGYTKKNAAAYWRAVQKSLAAQLKNAKNPKNPVPGPSGKTLKSIPQKNKGKFAG